MKNGTNKIACCDLFLQNVLRAMVVFSPKVIFFFSHHFLSLDGGKGGSPGVSLHIITENVNERNTNHTIAAFDLLNTVAARVS